MSANRPQIDSLARFEKALHDSDSEDDHALKVEEASVLMSKVDEMIDSVLLSTENMVKSPESDTLNLTASADSSKLYSDKHVQPQA